jgi:uncharacterized protein (TIGR02246 family)
METSMLARRSLIGLLAGAGAACATPAETATADAEIRAVIALMEAAWNRGDFSGYMEGFWNPGVVFVSGGRFQDGWQGTLDHYVRDYGGAPERRGTLHFDIVSIELLAPDAALLISNYQLERPEHPQVGINTRVMRRIDGRWVIAMNHVSSYDPTATSTAR